MWWRTVHIGSLKLSSWSAVHDTITLRQAQTIFQTTLSAYLVVVKSLDPLVVVGVIYPKTVEDLIASVTDPEQLALFIQEPVNEVETIISKSFLLMPISGGVIGDLEDQFEKGILSIILHRSTHDLSMTTNSNNNEEIGAKERKHVIAMVTKGDLQRWINEVEEHHNMN